MRKWTIDRAVETIRKKDKNSEDFKEAVKFLRKLEDNSILGIKLKLKRIDEKLTKMYLAINAIYSSWKRHSPEVEEEITTYEEEL